MYIGVDIGGTFTDLVSSEGGELHIHKLPSTPGDPSQALLHGLAHYQSQGWGTPTRISHGSTVATNAILERRGSRTALITTRGFRDLLAIGRQDRPQLYALQPQLPPALIPQKWCFEVPERLNHRGEIIQPLDKENAKTVLDQLNQHRIDSVAVCLLYSYLNPVHEKELKELILSQGRMEEWQISLSSEVLPEFREYERASTTTLEAYVRPVMSRYLQNIQHSLPEHCPLLVMNSDGGLMSSARARQQSVHTALSGPAAGVIGGSHLARLAGFEQVITLDMGGTSSDVSLCPGKLIHRSDSQIDGLPMRIRTLDIETIGAGGGSIAQVDPAGVLHVGPQSAGADPGPIIYGKGGEQITVTDAHALLGRLDPQYFLGGNIPLDPDLAVAPMTELASKLGLPIPRAVAGILELTNANIERALRRVSIARGHDPRDFTLVAFGGAGPLHACQVAQRLQIPRVLVPPHPGVLCALGLLMSDVIFETSRGVMRDLTPETTPPIRETLDQMAAAAKVQIAQEGVKSGEISLHKLVDLRYQGQSYELTIPYAEDLEKGFHRAHRQQYNHAFPERKIELVTLRVQAVGSIPKPNLIPESLQDGIPLQPLGELPSPLGIKTANNLSRYDREMLPPGGNLSGPALIHQMDSTTFLPSGWTAQVDGYRNLILEIAQ